MIGAVPYIAAWHLLVIGVVAGVIVAATRRGGRT